jgi:hypothetical protein
MCVIDKRKFRFTLWRRKCYKILSKNPLDSKNTYRSPCQNTKVVIKPDETRLIPENPSAEPQVSYMGYQFTEGFIYYFTDLETAKAYRRYTYNPVIFEGYVPAFTRYAKENDEECAREVVLTKRIE